MTEMLSEHFSVDEFIYSDTARVKKISNAMTTAHKAEAKHTCQYLLEPIRKLLNENYKTYCGKAVDHVGVKITSGYRSAALNTAVKGSSTSQHCKAQAADIEAIVYFKGGARQVMPYTELYALLKKMVKAGTLAIDQLIRERSLSGAVWVHVSLASQLKDCRKQFLIFDGRTYTIDNK